MAWTPLFFCLGAFLLSFIGTRLSIPELKRLRVIDTPSGRSNHAVPVPRGGGVALVLSALIFMSALGLNAYVACAGLGLMLVSFIDDMRSLPASVRFLAQAIAVIFCMQALPGRIAPFLPAYIEWAGIALLWLWFINLTNFMDGIDGISCMQTILMMAGICLMRYAAPFLPLFLMQQAAVLAAAAYGFYLFNRSPARVFMGDAGSIPLGFLNGYLLLSLAAYGAWAAALILPAYYLSDATFTLLRRAFRGAKIWQAHSEHAYQQAVRTGRTHYGVVSEISWLNAVLVVLAMLSQASMMAAIPAVFAAYLLTACLLTRFLHVRTSAVR